jgi:hypothetical protein
VFRPGAKRFWLYSDRLDEVAAYAKTLSLLQSEYDSEISRLKFDANSLIPILSNKEDSKSIQKLSELLNNLVSEPDFSLVIKRRTNGRVGISHASDRGFEDGGCEAECSNS